MSSEPFVIRQINFDVIKLLDHTGQFHQQIKVADAQKIARNVELDLVCFNRAEGTNLAFCKILNFNKWKYENEKKHKKEEKTNRKQCKEIQLSLNIAENDIEHKMRKANEFLDDGDDVVLIMKLRGREKGHFYLAEEKMNCIVKICEGHGKEVSRKKTSDLIIVRLVKI